MILFLLALACSRGADVTPPDRAEPTATPPEPTEEAVLPAPPAEPLATLVAVPTPLEWPADVGTSHFGLLVGGREQVDFAGAWIRPHPGPFIWGQVEVQPGTYDWEQPDRLVAGAREQRLAILATVWPFAQWDQEACRANQPRAEGAFPELGDLLYSPCDPAAYAAWLTALVERYDGDGVGDMPGLAYSIRHWEISNEPEMQEPQLTFFQEGPEAYLEILRLSYEAIKAADPNAVVFTAGQAGMRSQSVTYWRPILEGADGLFDLGNMHSIGSSDGFFALEYRAWLDELGYADKGYWITEALVGVGSQPGALQLDEDELAQITLVSYATAFGYGAEVVIRVGGHDPSGGPGEASKQTFLLLANTIGDFTAAILVAENAVRFDMPDGRVVYALWDGATLPPEVTGTVKEITYAGEEAQHDAAEVVSSVPILVVMEP
jgi:hypothetical protein